jgi:hypothetical protein
MSFLRKLLGGSEGGSNGSGTEKETAERTAERPATAAELDEAERQYELEIAREEARRLTDLQQRQLKYADKAWTPPRQGGERRADDEDADRADPPE